MATKTEVYIDASPLIAFLRSDSYHPFFRRLSSNLPALVIAEGHDFIS